MGVTKVYIVTLSETFIHFYFSLHTVITKALIYGDSNVVKYLPLLKEKKTDPSIQATTVSLATNSVLLRDLLSSPKVVHSLIIISAVTNLITAKFFDDYDDMLEHCRSVFNDLLLWTQEGREAMDGFAETVIVLYDMFLAPHLICFTLFSIQPCLNRQQVLNFERQVSTYYLYYLCYINTVLNQSSVV